MKRIPFEYRRIVYDALGDSYFPKQEKILRSVEDSLQFLIIAGGIGAAKSWTSARYILPEICLPSVVRTLNGWPEDSDLNIWLVGETYETSRIEFQYILDAIVGNPTLMSLCGGFREKPSMPKDGTWQMVTNLGVKIQTKSWTNYDSLHSIPVHILYVAEAGLLDTATYELRLIPRIGRTNGIMLMAGTFEASGSLFKDLFAYAETNTGMFRSFSVATWENTFSYPGGWNDPAIQMMRVSMSEDAFNERCGAIPMKPTGIVFPEFSQIANLTNREWNPELPVQIFVDAGSRYYVGAAQIINNDPFVFAEYYDDKVGTTERAIDWVCDQPWANNVTGGVIDVRAFEQKLIWQGGRAWSSHENPSTLRGINLRAQNVPVWAGIDRTKTMLFSLNVPKGDRGEPYKYNGRVGVARLKIRPECRRLIHELSSGYKYSEARRSGAQTGRRDLPIDANNDGCKALAYFLVDQYGFTEAMRQKPKKGFDAFGHIRRPPIPGGKTEGNIDLLNRITSGERGES